MEYQLIDNETVTEPITLAEVKAYSQIDADYSADDSVLETIIASARIRLEQYLNVGLANRDVLLQWQGGLIDLPLSPNGNVLSVKDKDDNTLSTDEYTVSPFQSKKIYVNSIAGDNLNYWYSILYNRVEISPFTQCEDITLIYTVTYNTGYDELPVGLKQALLAECDHLIKLRGMPITDVISKTASLLANGYSKNLVL